MRSLNAKETGQLPSRYLKYVTELLSARTAATKSPIFAQVCNHHLRMRGNVRTLESAMYSLSQRVLLVATI